MNELDSMLLESYHDQVRSFRYSTDCRQKAIVKNYPILVKLKELGYFKNNLSWRSSYYPDNIEVQVKDLPILKKNFEAFKVEEGYTLHDAGKALIRVWIHLGGNRAFTYYVKQLPEDSKCKIVTQSYINHDLVCEVV